MSEIHDVLSDVDAEVGRLDSWRKLQAKLRKIGNIEERCEEAEQRRAIAQRNAELIEKENENRFKSARAKIADEEAEANRRVEAREAAVSNREKLATADREDAQHILDGAKHDAEDILAKARADAEAEIAVIRDQNAGLIDQNNSLLARRDELDAQVKDGEARLAAIHAQLANFAALAKPQEQPK